MTLAIRLLFIAAAVYLVGLAMTATTAGECVGLMFGAACAGLMAAGRGR